MGKGGKKISAAQLEAAKKAAQLDKLRSTSAIKDEHFKNIHLLFGDLNTHRETGLNDMADVKNHLTK